jgi:hypothetical protein
VPGAEDATNAVAYFDIRENDKLEEAQLATWIRQAGALHCRARDEMMDDRLRGFRPGLAAEKRSGFGGGVGCSSRAPANKDSGELGRAGLSIGRRVASAAAEGEARSGLRRGVVMV